MKKPKYQLLDELTREERAALEADIRKRGIMVPVEKDEDGNILDGHHRDEIATKLGIDCPVVVRQFGTEQEKREHVIMMNLARRHMDTLRRGQALKMLLEERGIHTARGPKPDGANSDTMSEIAQQVGMSERHARRCLRQAEQYDALPEPLKEQVRSGEMTVPEAARSAERSRRDALRLEMAAAAPPEKPGGPIRTGDFRDLLADVADESVALILSDPPYDRESLPLYADLAREAKRVLVPGGSLITYCGNYAVGKVISAVEQHLLYWWQLALVHGGGSQRLPGKWVMVEWKPLLWFVKGGRRDSEYVADMVRSTPPTKVEHDWMQSEVEASYYIERLTSPGELVLDPMCGSGTTCLAALRLGRRALGIEMDHARAAVARSRLAGVLAAEAG
jgi:hypothetical protein